ncbi:MAG: radical SAM protein [Planctomycetota bacterium]
MVYAEAGRRRKIRLINPNSPLSNITMPEIIRNMTFTRKALFAPTGLTICAAVMPAEWEVELIDECTLDAPHRPTNNVDVVAISAMTTQAPRAYELADEYRRLGITVVMGGIHPSALPEEALEHADAVCQGDAESTLPHLIADWEEAANRGADPRTGLRRIYNWAEFETAPIATPRKDIFDPADYLVANPIQTTRGCPHNCNFCTTPAVFGRKYRQREIADIVEEIRAAQECHRAWCYIFADDNFGGNHQWTIEMCEALKPLKISWASQCDILISRNERLLTVMRASGCQGLILGLESPKQDTLAAAGKKFVQSETYADRIRKIQSHNIGLWGAFIFGFDTDTWQDCMRACRYAQVMKLAMSCYPILTPYPGTAIFDQYEREGRLRTRDWVRYNGASVVFHPKRMTAKELRHTQMAAFAEFFAPRSSLRRLELYPLKARSWVANLAIWKGIRHYYAKKGRQIPTFHDFLNPDARAWNYPDESWVDSTPSASDEAPSSMPPASATLEALAAQAIVHSEPLLQAAEHLQSRRGKIPPGI